MLTLLILTSSIFLSVSGVQHFTEVPVDTNVTLGETATLHCTVADRKGLVQWTKAAFPLGFNETIPSLERYSMRSDREGGQFDLVIVNTTLADQLTFECQVLPKDGDPPLRASAQLTVNVQSDPPIILHHPDGQTITLQEDKTNQEVLVCEARDGKPAPSMMWYRNHQQVLTGVNYSSYSTGGILRSSRSYINIDKTRANNGARYRCEIHQEDVAGPPQSVSVVLNILYAPEVPAISGYDNQELRVGAMVTLTCVSDGGNPAASVRWYRNNVLESFSQRRVDFSFQVKPEDNGAKLSCEASNSVSNETSKTYTLKVIFPPTAVTMAGPTDYEAKSSTDLTCTTTDSNPLAEVVWFINSEQIKAKVSLTIPNSKRKATITQVHSTKSGLKRESTLTIKTNSTLHGSLVSCRASNPKFAETVSDSRTLNVTYLPSSVKIHGYKSGTVLREGDFLSLTCVPSDANPRPLLMWTKGKSGQGTERHRGVSWTFSVSREDNGKTCTCKTDRGGVKARVTLTVHFAPDNINLAVSPDSLKEGEDATVTCEVGASSPEAKISWLKNGQPWRQGMKSVKWTLTAADHNAMVVCRASNTQWGSKENVTQLKVLLKPKFDVASLPPVLDVVEGESLSKQLAVSPSGVEYTLYKSNTRMNDDRFSVTSGVLNISSVSQSDSGSYRVEGTNSAGRATYSFVINVKYPARITSFRDVWVDEGSSALLQCTVDANPMSRDVVTWSRPGFEFGRTYSRLTEGVPSLTISKVDRQDAGSFICIADNKIGDPTSQTAKLHVRFAPEINKSPDLWRVAGDAGSTVSLRCRAEAAPNVTFVWSRRDRTVVTDDKHTLVDVQTVETLHERTLMLHDLSSSDYGNYVCNVSNAKGSDSQVFVLGRIRKPDPPTDFVFINATAHSITFTWQPGYNGGLPQSFRIRHKRTDSVRGYVYNDVKPLGASIYRVTGLDMATSYEFQVMSFNNRGRSEYTAEVVTAITADADSLDLAAVTDSVEIPTVAIIISCLVGVSVLALNIGLILYCIKRRNATSGNAHDKASSSGSTYFSKADNFSGKYVNDSRSYGTCDKSLGDFSDDCIQNFEPAESHLFLPRHNDSEDSIRFISRRPYSPTTSYSQGSSRPHSPVEFIPNIPPDSHHSNSRIYANSRRKNPPRSSSQKPLRIIEHSGDENEDTERKWIEGPYRVAMPSGQYTDEPRDWRDEASDKADAIYSIHSSYSDSTSLSDTDLEVVSRSHASLPRSQSSSRHSTSRRQPSGVPSVHTTRRSSSQSQSRPPPHRSRQAARARSTTPSRQHQHRQPRDEGPPLELRGHLV